MSAHGKNPFLEKGTVLNGKWEIIEHIATGGKGEVYRARQINLDRPVAVKIISEGLLASFDDDQEEIKATLERFRREVLTMAQVRHPNILQVYDQDQAVIQKGGTTSSIDYLVMEYIPGPTLRSILHSEGLRDNEKDIRKWIREYFFPILDGVQKLHDLGIVHRDLKPENVLLDEFTPKITDFGLAGGPRWQGVTRSHHMEGTIPYMPPEQIMDLGGTDSRGDIYALGKILYEVVIGKMGKDTAFPLKTAHLLNPDTLFLKRLDRIIQQATAEDKTKRIPSVSVLRKALLDTLEGTEETLFSSQRPRTKKARLAVAMVALLVVASIGFHILYHRAKSSQPPIAVPSSLPGVTPGLAPQKEKITPLNSNAPLTVKGKDGAILHLVPQGKLTFPESFGLQAGTFDVPAFYMDEIEVTNQQYVDFLNHVLSTIRVEDGVVKVNGDIWLLLEEVKEGYDPIMFHNGKFFVTDPKYDYYPVVRITAYGAEAYARFYRRRLPNEVEWFYVRRGGFKRSETPAVDSPEPSGTMMNMDNMHSHTGDTIHGQVSSPPTPPQSHQKLSDSVFDSKPNPYGIRGMDENVSEWGIRFQKTSLREKEETQYIILGGLNTGLTKENKMIQGIPRHPWEAFAEVGFRCVSDVTNYQ
ncbi:MAG: bifunctional serine/threonine-protein kinase/formylglycine-generating enzyme family protein [Thermodesulfobacteriota bacterium]|nr:MAG: bifunctional serine/threonine-protein kinase/formylglycine-generating enzyme family protein [Thermodesulfobacteriota bacterium]